MYIKPLTVFSIFLILALVLPVTNAQYNDVLVTYCINWFPSVPLPAAVQIPIKIWFDSSKYNASNVTVTVEIYENGTLLTSVTHKLSDIATGDFAYFIPGVSGVSYGWHNYTVVLRLTGEINLELSWTAKVNVGDKNWQCSYCQVYPYENCNNVTYTNPIETPPGKEPITTTNASSLSLEDIPGGRVGLALAGAGLIGAILVFLRGVRA